MQKPCRFSSARTGVLAVFVVLMAPYAIAQGLEASFANPPSSARPHTWWHWMNGNVTAEGITADLEAMASAGVGGVQVFDVQPGIPAGQVEYRSPEWLALVVHACEEAQRLGLEVCLHNCAGWSSSGGPWITPDRAMQMLVSSEIRVEGPGPVREALPQPLTRVDTYEDIAVVAFPTPLAEATPLPEYTVTTNWQGAEALLDGDLGTPVTIPATSSADPVWLAIEFARPVTLRSLTLPPTSGAAGGGELYVSADGRDYTRVAGFQAQDAWMLPAAGTVCFRPATGRWFRLVLSPMGSRGGMVRMAEITLEQGARLDSWAVKAGYDRANSPTRQTVTVEPDACIDPGQVRDLTDRLQEDGTLNWEAPPGSWTILRLGHTPTGKDNHPASESGRGLEVDKLSKEAVGFHFEQVIGEVIKAGAPIGDTGLRHVLIDSYEVGCQNWTAKMPAEFQRLRAYDMTRYLPSLAGRVVGDVDTTERFLWDFRRTLADLFHENYFGHFAELCHSRGLMLSVEPYGNGNFDELTSGGAADIPMSEFWVRGGPGNAKLAASIAHTYGRPVVGAESFTASDVNGRWQNHPGSLKALGDQVFCGGVNRYIFHRYAHQPWLGVRPGMTMGPWGFHFERTNTWWEQGAAWLTYIARCQYLLQSGEYVADFLFLAEENSPASMPPVSLPPGYEYDVCSPEVVMERLTVEDGWLVAHNGSRYRALVLPPSDRMTPALLERIVSLIDAGATVVGPAPEASPSLSDYPDADTRVASLAARLPSGSPQDLISRWGLQPDFEVLDGHREDVRFIHRRIGNAEVYFVASSAPRARSVRAAFRVESMRPEIWDPMAGVTRWAPAFSSEAGRTVVPLSLDPSGSVFVVFRQPIGDMDSVTSVTRDGGDPFAPSMPEGLTLEILQATYGVLTQNLPDAVDVTELARSRVRDGRLEIPASNELAGDPAPGVVKRLVIEYTVDGESRTAAAVEGTTITLPAEGETGEMGILRAVYGVVGDPLPPPTESLKRDVTQTLRERVEGATLTVTASNSLAGDPAYLVPKQLQVEYALNGQRYSVVVSENEVLALPLGTEGAIRSALRPTPVLEATEAGDVIVTAWEDGEWSASARSGAVSKATLKGLPDPIDVPGRWVVSFDPRLGAPTRVTFGHLMSWTDHPHEGVRYYSGTATYARTIVLPSLTAGQRLLLDLGDVREMARVRLNGTDLGVLWKQPFAVDITDAAVPGANRLEVEVTNLWPNRLIGDEQLPDDCEWNGDGSLRAWPEWFLKGDPRPTQRVAFTTWKHWRAGSELLPSGLLGPVRVYTGQRVQLAR